MTAPELLLAEHNICAGLFEEDLLQAVCELEFRGKELVVKNFITSSRFDDSGVCFVFVKRVFEELLAEKEAEGIVIPPESAALRWAAQLAGDKTRKDGSLLIREGHFRPSAE